MFKFFFVGYALSEAVDVGVGRLSALCGKTSQNFQGPPCLVIRKSLESELHRIV